MPDEISPGETSRKVATWERHGQSIAIGIVMMLVGWTANTLVDGRTKTAETAGQISFITQQLVELKGLVQSMQGNYVPREDFRDHEARLRALESATRSKP